MFYYLYQITNNLNGKIYVGVHKTKDMNDGYMGSGKVIRSAIAKHGVENFTKVILEQFDTSTAMYAREKEVVTEEFLARDDTYNLRRGGYGGFDYIAKHKLNNNNKDQVAIGKRISETTTGRPNPRVIERNKLAHARGEFIQHYFSARPDNASLGNSPESIAKKKETWKLTGRGRSEKNSQYGTIWITTGFESKKIKKTDSIPDGWRRGRS